MLQKYLDLSTLKRLIASSRKYQKINTKFDSTLHVLLPTTSDLFPPTMLCEMHYFDN